MGGWLDVWPDIDNKALNWPTVAELGKILNIRQILRKLQIPKITKDTKIQLVSKNRKLENQPYIKPLPINYTSLREVKYLQYKFYFQGKP